jgi:hypothetical protein
MWVEFMKAITLYKTDMAEAVWFGLLKRRNEFAPPDALFVRTPWQDRRRRQRYGAGLHELRMGPADTWAVGGGLDNKEKVMAHRLRYRASCAAISESM